MENINYICPMPQFWNIIYLKLKDFWDKDLQKVPSEPPKPLILAGWNFTKDWQKKLRWIETLNWAKDNNCTHLIPNLTDAEKYFG